MTQIIKQENFTLDLRFNSRFIFQQLDSLQLTGPPKAKEDADKDRWDEI